MTITFSLVTLQLLAVLIWFVVDPPNTVIDYDGQRTLHSGSRGVKMQHYRPSDDLLVGLQYFTDGHGTIYALKIHGNPESFSEARSIGLTMYTTCMVWLAFIPIFFGTTRSTEKVRWTVRLPG